MSAIHVRPMTARDIPATAAWLVELPLMQRYNLTVERARQQFETALVQADILLVADVGGDSACGFVWCLPKGAFGRSVYLRLIGVRVDLSGAGVGAALLGAAEQAAVERKSDLVLLVSDFNTDAQRFYQRQGYTQAGALPGYVLPDVSELIYWKPLGRTAAAT
ncbi:MAG: GNAT family N-acetyltransferase [Chloroflexi bacterium]|nr:GNAT family N-acetyltransferase [Chloroflexota bacterium]MCC6892245.1 GNAT family N-acetyltransferase [Anaerolineae bacterium]